MTSAGEARRGDLLPAADLRARLCVDEKLSKRAAVHIRDEADAFATRLVTRAFASRAQRSSSGPLEAGDVWEALLTDPASTWLVEKLGLWTSPGVADAPALPPDLPLPRPPSDAPDAHLLPRLLWLRHAATGAPAPMHEALLEPCDDDVDGDGHSAKRARNEPGSWALHPALLATGAAAV